ncbi:Glutathione S-transferase omega-1 [Daphnia magna]|uniref:Glutathione S-transferase omega-1 n=1 Tax=Daphnia magna TaxID=35525 RepID=A0A164JV17_9CRUS|nr:Glutathione S-transferase omega-1 [Daphnia magna]
MKFYPYAQKTTLVLAAKKILNKVVNHNLVTKPDWFFYRNPLGKVPCLEFDGKLIFESLITANYLDEVYPSPYLLNSTDPFCKAQDRILIEMSNVFP